MHHTAYLRLDLRSFDNPATAGLLKKLLRAETNRCRPQISANRSLYWSGVVTRLMQKLGHAPAHIAEYRQLYGRG